MDHALSLVPEGSTIGLGTGRAATAFLHGLAERVRAGFRVTGVPTSDAIAALATELGIPLTTLDRVDQLAVDVDGADEVDPQLNVIKGHGGALVREMVVAASAKKLVLLIGPEKLVGVLGEHGLLPVEVVPFAVPLVRRRLKALGLDAELRQQEGQTFISDNGNPIFDCRVGPLADPAMIDVALRAIPGVVGTGLFLGMADVVLIQDETGARIRERTNP